MGWGGVPAPLLEGWRYFQLTWVSLNWSSGGDLGKLSVIAGVLGLGDGESDAEEVVGCVKYAIWEKLGSDWVAFKAIRLNDN